MNRGKRVTRARLEEIAYENPGSQVEIDDEYGIAVLKIGSREWFASLTHDEAQAWAGVADR